MKAVVYTEYGSPDVLQVKEVAKPAPKDHEVLVRVNAVSVNYGDLIARRFSSVSAREFNMPSFFWLPAKIAFGLRKPVNPILGNEFAGVIEAAGKDVKRFKKGDPVFGFRGMRMGANAEYLCVPENGMIALKPDNMSDEEAATVPGGAMTALTLLRKVNIQPGQKVLVNGASGGIGSYAVQLAKHYGAEVTGVCSTPRLEFVKSLGADKVIDYTKEDFTTRSSEKYDVVFDILGRVSFSKCRRVLTENGTLQYVSFKLPQLLQMLWTSITGSSQKVICALSNETLDDLLRVKDLVEAGKIKTVIDRCYPLEQAAEAHRYIEAGNKQANVVLSLAHQNGAHS